MSLLLIPLALVGCGAPPPPALSSTSRAERLQAVHNAQNQYGAHRRPVLADDKEALCARWHCSALALDFRFRPDGTFTRAGLIDWNGTYRLLSEGLLELAYNCGITVKTNYRLSGDTLQLKEDITWLTFTRAD